MKGLIKDSYTSRFPLDDLGKQINDGSTFNGLLEALDNHQSVYEYLGVFDSLVREGVFVCLCEIMNCEYDFIYKKWLQL